ncbi:MAG: right-handed parallel beta-helix repeat-containing protein, partial [Thermoplasmata archaeon]|nr:right-handed parallel beta-helix repeat-containing protein [Thermoplasmata archaeon]
RHTLLGLYLNAASRVRTGVAETAPFGTPHARIHITSDADFANQAATEGWAGNGSQGNPYIIENYEINGNWGSHCIWIENTSVYFIIRNCNLWNATSSGSKPYGAGIALDNVQNGVVDNNKCNNSRRGIFLYNSSNNTITNNNASSNSYYGLHLDSSNNNTIADNNAFSNGQCGIFLDYSSNSNISNNNASIHDHYGIRLVSSSNNTIADNDAFSNGDSGIYLSSSSNNNTITGNNVSGNCDGIHLDYSDSNTITGNNASGNHDHCICLFYSHLSLIHIS